MRHGVRGTGLALGGDLEVPLVHADVLSGNYLNIPGRSGVENLFDPDHPGRSRIIPRMIRE